MKKRLLSLLLCLVAVLTLLPLPALADGGHSHCICGGDVTAGDHTGHADVRPISRGTAPPALPMPTEPPMSI